MPPLPVDPVEIDLARAITVGLAQSVEQPVEHGVVATGDDQGTDKPKLGLLRLIQWQLLFWIETQPTVVTQLQRSPPVETDFITNCPR